MFGGRWDQGEATVIASHVARTSSDGGIDRDFVADVRTTAGDVFRAKIETPTIATDFWDPKPGDVVKVLVHPKSRKVKFDKADPSISARAHRRDSDRAFAEISEQSPGSDSAPVAPTVSGLRGFGGAQVIDARNDPDMRRQVLAALHGQDIDVSALAASGTPASPAASAEDPIDRLAKLAEFHDNGLISSAEFDTQKARLLGET